MIGEFGGIRTIRFKERVEFDDDGSQRVRGEEDFLVRGDLADVAV